MAEYALGATLMVGILVASLTAIDVPQILQDILSNTMHGDNSSGTLTVRSYGVPYSATGSGSSSSPSSTVPASILASSSLIPPPGPGEQQICLDGNICANIPIIGGDGTIETAGSNGTKLIRLMAVTYDQIVEQLKAENADPGLISLIEDLAVEGHELADFMDTFATTSAIETNYTAYATSGTPEDEDQYRSYLLLFSGPQAQFSRAKGYLDNYFTNHPELLTSLQETKTLIDLEAENINTIYDNTETFVHTYAGSQDFTPLEVGPDLVHQDSNTICGATVSNSCWWQNNNGEWQQTGSTSSASAGP